MKNKGKGDNGDSKDCPLMFPELSLVDHSRMCPRYSLVLQRTDDSGIGVEEIDILQSELELLLASAAKRMRILASESNVLQNWTDKGKETDKPALSAAVAADTVCGSPGKRSLTKDSDEKATPSKKFKEALGRPVPVPARSKPSQTPPPLSPPIRSESLSPESPSSSEVVQKLPTKIDAPSRFWNLVEPYCAEITNDDLKVLEDIMHMHSDVSDLTRIPALGKSFVHRWFKEDKKVEEKEGRVESKSSSTTKSSSKLSTTKQNGTSSSSKEKLSKANDSDKSGFGPLTQRLIQALMEENVMAAPEDASFMDLDGEDGGMASISSRSLARQLNLGNTAALEKRIRQELEEQGLLDFDSGAEDGADEDEILRELKKRQQELAAVSEQNYSVAKHLLEMAREEMRKQEVRKKLAIADAEVLDAYRKLQAIKQRKKTPTKKERDAVWKALHEREALVKQLNGQE